MTRWEYEKRFSCWWYLMSHTWRVAWCPEMNGGVGERRIVCVYCGKER